MKNNNETRRFSIRKYTVGVVSIITGITIFVSGQHAQAAEMTQSSSDFNEQSQQTEQVEHKEDTTHLSYELNQEGTQLANQRLIKRTNLMAMYKKRVIKYNKIQHKRHH
ncbi:YSIRK-type signal peptide-containing protein [Staphylococcus epidermidis]